MKTVLILTTMMLVSGFMWSIFCAEIALSQADVLRITKEQLRERMGDPDLIIIDVRSAHDWDDSKTKIKGSIREDPQNIGSWINKYPKNKTFVLY